MICPNCQQPVEDGRTVCPHCGAPAPPPTAPASVWPPAPVGGGPLPTLEPRLLTKAVWADVTLGVVATLASLLVGGLGVIVMPILYFVLRPTLPAFARGIGYGVLVTALLLLGAFALCFYGLSREGH